MKLLERNPWAGLVFSCVLAIALCSSAAAQEKIKISGKGTYAALQRMSLAFDDVEGRDVFISEWEGVNWSTGEHKFMDGAEVHYVTHGDYIKGNGPFWGYIKMIHNGDTAYSKFKGMAVTTLSPLGKPITTFEGEIEGVRGTGQYEGFQGRLTFKNKMISSAIMTSEWEGWYSIKKN